MATEIERKFLVAKPPPDLAQRQGVPILQGYLAVAADGAEVRLRRKGTTYWQTVKRGTGLVRTEVEIALEPAQFETLWPLTEGRRLEKTRYRIEHGNDVLELDVYAGPLAGLCTVEVEFGSQRASREFAPPAWFGAEVTDDARYGNRELARHGLPRDDAPQP